MRMDGAQQHDGGDQPLGPKRLTSNVPHAMSGSTSYTLAMSLARLGEQRRLGSGSAATAVACGSSR